VKFQVNGADRETGEAVEIVIDAADEVAAEAVANRRNMVVATVNRMPSVVQPSVQRSTPGHDPQVPALNVHLPKRTSSFGIVSLIFGLLAFVVCWIPIIGIVSMPISGLGLLFGLIGLLIAIKRRAAAVGYPLAGVLVSGLAIWIAWSVAAAPVRKSTSAIIERAKASTTPSAWTKAGEIVASGDMRIAVLSARIGEVDLVDTIRAHSSPWKSSETYLRILVNVTNGSPNKKADFATWMGRDYSLSRDYAVIRDKHGNTYKRISFGVSTRAENAIERESLYPGTSLQDVLVFERPVDGFEYLRLELPADNFGGTGMIRFEIPADMIER
jgi:hypothetical protein